MPGQRVRYNRWKTYRQKLSHRHSEQRFIREIIFGQRRPIRYYQITKGDTPDPTGDNSCYIISLDAAYPTAHHLFIAPLQVHPWWESGTTWKSALNNLRLILQPYIFYCLIRPWLRLFKIPGFRRGFYKLIHLLNGFRTVLPSNLAMVLVAA